MLKTICHVFRSVKIFARNHEALSFNISQSDIDASVTLIMSTNIDLFHHQHCTTSWKSITACTVWAPTRCQTNAKSALTALKLLQTPWSDTPRGRGVHPTIVHRTALPRSTRARMTPRWFCSWNSSDTPRTNWTSMCRATWATCLCITYVEFENIYFGS